MAQEIATLAGGCFWCTEAVFDDVIGVSAVESGYIGGTVPDPGYEQVCRGDTGHVEAVRITFDPAVVSYDVLLDIFFDTHDPTQLDRQGNDVGSQYRSAIFPHDESQKAAALHAIERAQTHHPHPVVTTIEDGAAPWYAAEAHHQDYFEREGAGNPYCMAVVAPKLQKFRKSHAERIKRQPA